MTDRGAHVWLTARLGPRVFGCVAVLLLAVAACGSDSLESNDDGAVSATTVVGPTESEELPTEPVVPSDVAEPVSEGRSAATAATPPPDIRNATLVDEGGPPLPLGTVDSLPNEDRLDFLFELCSAGCWRDAHFVDPSNPIAGAGPWPAGRPFHVRHGFVNGGSEPLGPGFDIALYVFALGGDAPGPTERYTSDYVLRAETERCGPTYETQTGPVTCEWFVHEFPEGMPLGRWAIWAVWEAPCSAWVEYGLTTSCEDPDQVVSFFASGVDSPFFTPDPASHYGDGPQYNEPDMAAMTPEEVEEFYAALSHETTGVGDETDTDGEPAFEIDASGAAATAGTPEPDFDGAVAGDEEGERLPLGTVDAPAIEDRLDFLVEQCLDQNECFRDAMFVNPDDPTRRSAAWQAGRPFHIRHGFVNEGDTPLGDAFDVVIYITSLDEPGEAGGESVAGTVRYTSDYVLRGTTDQCGPTYRSQTGPVTCEWFVHEFPDGLPAGRHALWAFWEAPCSAWIEYGFVDDCADSGDVMALFASGVDSPWEDAAVIWDQY